MRNMKKNINTTKDFFLEDKPLFGMDIGHNTIRVIQFDVTKKKPRLVGYGAIDFEQSAIIKGVIVNPELIAEQVVKLFKSELVGDISTDRVALSIPAIHAITQSAQLPNISTKDLEEAVRIEAEQNLLSNLDSVYLDFTITRKDSDGLKVFIVAIPKKIVDSYLVLTRMLGLEAIIINSSIGAVAQLFSLDKLSDIPSMLIDFGAVSTDISVDSSGLVVSGNVAFGGDNITKTITKALNLTTEEAVSIASKQGLSAGGEIQKLIISALQPSLDILLKEIRRTVRYYEQRFPNEPPIGQVITMGGGSNMPGLASYLTEHLRLPVRQFYLADHIDFGDLQQFNKADRSSFATAAGLAITKPKEIFK